MTHRSSGVYILAEIVSHGSPMTRRGLAREVGVDPANIGRQLTRLIELGLVEFGEPYRCPGSKRLEMTYGPGPLLTHWAHEIAARGDE